MEYQINLCVLGLILFLMKALFCYVLILAISSPCAVCHASSIFSREGPFAAQALVFFEKHFYYELLQWLVTLRRYVCVHLFPLHPLPKALRPVMFHDVASSIPVQRWKCFSHYVAFRHKDTGQSSAL